MWVVEDAPELIYCLAISPRLIGNHALDLPQRTHKDPDRVVPSSDVGVKPRQPGVLELSGISLVSLWDQNTWVELARTRSATVG
jgi:hypothetical protein